MRRVVLYLLTFVVCVMAVSVVSPEMRETLGFPVYMTMNEGDVSLIQSWLPFDMHISADQGQVIKVNDSVTHWRYEFGRDSYIIEPLKSGVVNLEMKLFGLIPIRRITVSVFPKAEVVVGGHSIGVLLASVES